MGFGAVFPSEFVYTELPKLLLLESVRPAFSIALSPFFAFSTTRTYEGPILIPVHKQITTENVKRAAGIQAKTMSRVMIVCWPVAAAAAHVGHLLCK